MVMVVISPTTQSTTTRDKTSTAHARESRVSCDRMRTELSMTRDLRLKTSHRQLLDERLKGD
jgi:hypothetical protein